MSTTIKRRKIRFYSDPKRVIVRFFFPGPETRVLSIIGKVVSMPEEAARLSLNQTLRDFFDVFNHRMISLFYRAWEKHDCTAGFEQWLLKGSDDRFARCLFAVAGLGTTGLCDRLTIDERSILRYVGLLGQRPRSACRPAAADRPHGHW